MEPQTQRVGLWVPVQWQVGTCSGNMVSAEEAWLSLGWGAEPGCQGSAWTLEMTAASETWGCSLWKVSKAPWSVATWLWVKERGHLLAAPQAPVSWDDIQQGPQGLSSCSQGC